MPVEGNDMMKRFIQKLVNELIKDGERKGLWRFKQKETTNEVK